MQILWLVHQAPLTPRNFTSEKIHAANEDAPWDIRVKNLANGNHIEAGRRSRRWHQRAQDCGSMGLLQGARPVLSAEAATSSHQALEESVVKLASLSQVRRLAHSVIATTTAGPSRIGACVVEALGFATLLTHEHVSRTSASPQSSSTALSLGHPPRLRRFIATTFEVRL